MLRVLPVWLDRRVRKAWLDRRVRRAQRVLMAQPDRRDRKESQARPVRQAPPVRRVRKGRPEQQGRWGRRVPVEAQRVPPVQREQRALEEEQQVRQERWVLLVQRDRRVRRALPEQRVPQAPPAPQGLPGLRGPLVLLDLPARVAHRDRRVHKDQSARQAWRVQPER